MAFAAEPAVAPDAAALRFFRVQRLTSRRAGERCRSAKEIELPTREEFVRTIWEETIDPWARASWIDAFITAAKSRPDGSFADAGNALAKLLASGVDRNDIGAVARAVAYEVAFSLLYMLDDPGVDDGNVFMLHESLLSADPSGREGRPAD